ncbi:MAG TPA: EAL domain-containing protein [Agromyces sp.]|nr:EAL domain-containing protein [Agromyces sp.]
MHDEHGLAHELRFAAARGEITARFQVQVDVRRGLVVALEALSRWQHPRLGIVPPNAFIPLAEAIEAMNAVGDVMLEAACRYGAALASAGRRIGIAVNVAAEQLSQRRFVERVAHHLESSGLPSALLTLELTESRPPPASAARTLVAVRSLGVGVSIDDVRTLEEAEDRIRSLPITELKVDRSVIRRLPEESHDAAVLVGFAREQGLQSVAEGVETQSQWEAVRALGFDRAQGYLFGRPMTPDQMTIRLEEAAGRRGGSRGSSGTAQSEL